MKLKRLLLLTMMLWAIQSLAQKSYWKSVSSYDAVKLLKGKPVFAGSFKPNAFKLLCLDAGSLNNIISKAPTEGRTDILRNGALVTIPLADGHTEQFRIVRMEIMQPKLQARYPFIRAYIGKSVDDPSKIIRCDYSPIGFHATITIAGKPSVYINPVNRENSLYAVYARDRKDIHAGSFSCITEGTAKEESSLTNKITHEGNIDDGKLRVYRLALSATGDWSQALMTGSEVTTQDSINTVMASLTAYLVRANEVYETDFSIRMIFCDNMDTLIFLNPNTDPYTGFSSLNGQLQKTCDARIGDANYDIGHVLDIYAAPGNGNAGYIGCVCKTGRKGSGATGYPDPSLVDYAVIDYWTHEMGHQYGANHTFTFNANQGLFGERSLASIEPGSGSTIMGYAGITGNTDVQPHSDDYFSTSSIAQVSNYIENITAGGKCAVATETGDHAPTASAGNDYTIPASTPFMLNGSASDIDKSDVLTYTWEQIDVWDKSSNSNTYPTSTTTQGPTFRSVPPTVSTNRYFPSIETILTGQTANQWESLSSVSRTLNFRFVVRDNHPGGGQTASDNVLLTVDGASGPFAVTSPNTTVNWNDGDTYTVTWDVANTNAAPVNCSQVNILLSTDGGNTFPYLLKQNTINDGTEDVTIPDLPGATSTARIKIQSVGNIFFDISDKDFSIANALPVSWLSFTAEKSGSRNALLNWSTANEINNNHFEVERSADGIAFTKISNVAAGNNPNAVQHYSYTDNNIKTGTNYYRIKQVDNDGKFTYSKTASVTIDASGISWSLQPNPASTKTTIVFNNNFTSVDITINDANGRQVYKNKLSAVNANQTFDINVSSFAKGVYLVTINTGNETNIQKLVVN